MAAAIGISPLISCRLCWHRRWAAAGRQERRRNATFILKKSMSERRGGGFVASYSYFLRRPEVVRCWGHSQVVASGRGKGGWNSVLVRRPAKRDRIQSAQMGRVQ